MARRIERINEEVKKELSKLIKNDIKDPRISEMVSITNVKVTNDLRYAKVYVSIYGTQQQQEDTIEGLELSLIHICKSQSNNADSED